MAGRDALLGSHHRCNPWRPCGRCRRIARRAPQRELGDELVDQRGRIESSRPAMFARHLHRLGDLLAEADVVPPESVVFSCRSPGSSSAGWCGHRLEQGMPATACPGTSRLRLGVEAGQQLGGDDEELQRVVEGAEPALDLCLLSTVALVGLLRLGVVLAARRHHDRRLGVLPPRVLAASSADLLVVEDAELAVEGDDLGLQAERRDLRRSGRRCPRRRRRCARASAASRRLRPCAPSAPSPRRTGPPARPAPRTPGRAASVERCETLSRRLDTWQRRAVGHRRPASSRSGGGRGRRVAEPLVRVAAAVEIGVPVRPMKSRSAEPRASPGRDALLGAVGLIGEDDDVAPVVEDARRPRSGRSS